MDTEQDESVELVDLNENGTEPTESESIVVANGDASSNSSGENNANDDNPEEDDVNNNHLEDSSEDIGDDAAEISEERNCLLRLTFRDEGTFDELHQTIGKCIRDALVSLKKSSNVVVKRDENQLEIYEIPVSDNNDSIFMIDTFPTERANETDVPKYDAGNEVLNNESDEPVKKDEDDKPKGVCWNCAGNHSLRECTEPRDYVAINKARKEFQQSNKSERYHLEADQKFSQFMPGKISESLRQALGLRSRELPLYIYKMRLYGYPPGWLEDAKIAHSGLTLFNAENKPSADKGVEDGEVDKVTFDASKFIEYPGFNAEMPSHIIDDTDYHRVPPMQFGHSKDGLMQLLQNNLAKSYKRKRLKFDVDGEEAKETLKGDDMDLANSDDEDSPMLFPQPRPTSQSNSSNLQNNDTETPASPAPDETLDDSTQLSLNELQQKQEEILRALADAASDADSNSVPSEPHSAEPNRDENGEAQDKPNDEINKAEEVVQQAIAEAEIIPTEENQTEASVEEAIEIPETPKACGHSRESVFGTPLIKSASPYTSLPTGSKWSEGVTDVIDFENLPDSTGTYRKLSGIIQKVRTVVKQINEDSDPDDL